MGKLSKIIVLFVVCINLFASSNGNDNIEIKKLINSLYAEPIDGFVCGDGKPVDYWRGKYSQYYTKQIVDIVLQKAQESREPGILRTWDPRFYCLVIFDVGRVTKIRIVDIYKKESMVAALVVYNTSHYVDKNEVVTEYFFKKEKNVWRICDQRFGKTVDKPWKNVSDLKRLIPDSRVSGLLDQLIYSE